MGKDKKFLTKNEFRIDLNPSHMGKDKVAHPAYITGRKGHKFYANGTTHSTYTKYGEPTYDFGENPNKNNAQTDKRKSRITLPFWQSDKLFSKDKLNNYRYSNKTRREIKKFNKKIDKKRQ